jgi:hypothetical protein
MTKARITLSFPVLLLAGCTPSEAGFQPADKVEVQPDVLIAEDGRQVLLCEESPSCPASGDDALARHGGLVAISACGFELVDQNTWSRNDAVLDGLAEVLPEVDMTVVLRDLDRSGTRVTSSEPHLAALDHLHAAFRWNATDTKDPSWMPQGVSGSADAADDERVAGREVLAVSWYHKPEKTSQPSLNHGSRVSFADVTDLSEGTVPYRHVLLVEPYDDGGTPNFRAIKLHVGGIAWTGRYMYAVDTMRGLRVFDTERMIAVDGRDASIGRNAGTGEYNAYGYEYVMPQVGAYFNLEGACGFRFSYVALDKTGETPALVTGEFRDGANIAGKLARWNLDGERLAVTDVDSDAIRPIQVFLAQESFLQGALSIRGEWWLSSADGKGKLYRSSPADASQGHGWVFGPEDLMYSASQDALWSASEFPNHRYVFSTSVSAYP